MWVVAAIVVVFAVIAFARAPEIEAEPVTAKPNSS
jgi:hypothetical protein